MQAKKAPVPWVLPWVPRVSQLANIMSVNRLLEIASQVEEEVQQIDNLPAPDDVEGEDEDTSSLHGRLWDQVGNDNQWILLTNFDQATLEDIRRDMEPFIEANRRRGPPPKINYTDGLIILLMHYKCGEDIETLAARSGYQRGAVESCINRMRPILYDTLYSRWWEARRRPVPLSHTNFPYVALLADSMTWPCFRPRGRFEDAKTYWDAKNGIYGIKKEIAVMAAPPHYALFASDGFPGSVHDYTIHKRVFTDYTSYLEKTTDEHTALRTDQAESSWAVILDKAYIGSPTDTPGERRITPKKPAPTRPLSAADRERNTEINRLRVKVECFFGRMQKLWKMARDFYRSDHAHFDADSNIMIMLTNEHIRMNALEPEEREFHKKIKQSLKQHSQTMLAKRRASTQRYLRAKRARLAAVAGIRRVAEFASAGSTT